jgi:hypothetical protein
MSALPQKADIRRLDLHVRFGPITDIEVRCVPEADIASA